MTLNVENMAEIQVNPTQLFNAPIPEDIKTLLEQSFKVACSGKSSQFLYNIDLYLTHATSKLSYDMFYNTEFNYLMSKADILKVSELTIRNLSKDFVAIMGVLHNYVCVAIDTATVSKEEGVEGRHTFPNRLLTRNGSVIKNLANRGLIDNVGDIDRLLGQLETNKTSNGLKDGTVFAIWLDIVGFKGVNPVFKITSMRSRMAVGKNKDFVVIPIAFYYTVTEILKGMLKDRAFKFVKQTEYGVKKHIATFSPDTVKKYYADCPQEQVDTKIRKTKVGFDVVNIRIKAYDLESSVTSLGVASFRPEMLDEIKPIKANVVDKSMHNLNYDTITSVYKTKVSNLNVKQMREVKFYDVKSFATLKEAQEGLILYGSKLSPREVYMLMKNNPLLFGDVDSAIATREKANPKVAKSLKLVDIGDLSEEEKIERITAMLKSGLVKITYITSKNVQGEKLCTNNPALLERYLGKDYVPKLETIRKRIEAVRDMLKAGVITSKDMLERVAVKYDILNHVDTESLLRGSDFLTTGVAILDETLEVLKSKAKDRSPTNILARNVKAVESKNFYFSFDVTRIVNVEFAEYVPSSKSKAV